MLKDVGMTMLRSTGTRCSTVYAKAGAAPQRVVGQLPMDVHARAHTCLPIVCHLCCMSVVLDNKIYLDLPALSPDTKK